jgi:mannose-6-phosphate isomerase-like protein (cupin superfamily)
MKRNNFESITLEDTGNMHDGIGILKHASLFSRTDFSSQIQFINVTVIPPGATIGDHTHGADEELYIILEGEGKMSFDGVESPVTKGDILVNGFNGSHSLENNAEEDMKILVMEVK